MRLSEQGRRLLQGFEGLSLTAYRDPPTSDPAEQLWSIGYGHQLGKGPQWAGKTISREEADRLFTQDVASREDAVSLLAPTDNQARFDAMVSLAYNIGLGETRFPSSTVRRLHNLGDYQGAADAFRLWNKSGGAVSPVLVSRREKERGIYLYGYGQVYTPPAPSSPTPPPATPPPVATGPDGSGVSLALSGLLFFCPSCGVRCRVSVGVE